MNISDYQDFDTLRDHVLARPDMYIGPVVPGVMEGVWVIKPTVEEFEYLSEITYIPGLLKIIREVLDNVLDEVQRPDHIVTSVKVTIPESLEDPWIVYNDTTHGIPLANDAEVPQMVFGKFLTGGNFNDSVFRAGVGQNGYGVKLTNVFSKRLEVELVTEQRACNLVWTENMMTASRPKFGSRSKAKTDSVQVKFVPDYAKFGVTSWEDGALQGTLALAKKTVYDLSTCSQASVYLNKRVLRTKTFKSMVNLYLGSDTRFKPRVQLALEPHTEIIVCRQASGTFQQVSWVNGMCTMGGGEHVRQATSLIMDSVMGKLREKNKTLPTRIRGQIQGSLGVFVNVTGLDKPTFDSQSKDRLKTKVPMGKLEDKSGASLVRVLELDSFLKNLISDKEIAELRKTDGKKKKTLMGIDHLHDADEAGGKHAGRSTLMISEGTSALKLCLDARDIVGVKYFGAFPVRGKFLNVRKASSKQVAENKIITDLKAVLGLQMDKTYTTEVERQTLRYGKVLLCTDSDVDGYHIQGLFMNFIEHYWPALLETGFVMGLLTPIIRAKKTGGKEVVDFYSLLEYKDWKKARGEAANNFVLKYYKGLGTWDTKDVHELFRKHGEKGLSVQYYSNSPDTMKDSLDMAFGAGESSKRKRWVMDAMENGPMDLGDTGVSPSRARRKVESFVHGDLAEYSVYSNQRSLPSVVDGLKPSQRKILWVALHISGFTTKAKEIKVSQLASRVSEETEYHHGEVSLANAIVSMAQDFVGSGNNLPLLQGNGNFGSRHMGGDDAAATRYIFTNLEPLAKEIFRPDDLGILDRLDVEGKIVEPRYFFPVIPMVLVNGVTGMGTGFRCVVPSFSTKSVINVLKLRLNGTPGTTFEDVLTVNPLVPFFQGFNGVVHVGGVGGTSGNGFQTTGVAKVAGKGVYDITELPVGTWSNNYKAFLEAELGKEDGWLLSFRDGCTSQVNFTVTVDPEKLTHTDPLEFLTKLKLISKFQSFTDMHMFNPDGMIKHYESLGDVLEDYYKTRIAAYVDRKEHILASLDQISEKLSEQHRFLTLVIKGDLLLLGRSRRDLNSGLERHKFMRLDGTFRYLLDLPAHAFTYDYMDDIEEKRKAHRYKCVSIRSTTPEQIWFAELQHLENVLG
jgi:DNA topoisomerase II